jgi:hypothetical protein
MAMKIRSRTWEKDAWVEGHRGKAKKAWLHRHGNFREKVTEKVRSTQ